MFENLSERLGGVFDRLTKQGALSEDDVKTALREVRVALLEADVSLAPGAAFGERFGRFARLCVTAVEPERLEVDQRKLLGTVGILVCGAGRMDAGRHDRQRP